MCTGSIVSPNKPIVPDIGLPQEPICLFSFFRALERPTLENRHYTPLITEEPRNEESSRCRVHVFANLQFWCCGTGRLPQRCRLGFWVLSSLPCPQRKRTKLSKILQIALIDRSQGQGGEIGKARGRE